MGVDTHCPYCALQCGMHLEASAGGVVVQPLDFPTNRGGLCQKGWTAAELLDHPQRLLAPLMRERRDAPLRTVTWQAALARIAAPALIPDSAVICRCNTVTKGMLVRSWRGGAQSTVDPMTATRAGSGCGTCRDAVGGIAAWLRRGEGR